MLPTSRKDIDLFLSLDCNIAMTLGHLEDCSSMQPLIQLNLSVAAEP